MPPEFECRREILLAATPEEVWEAVATSEGNAAWLFPSEIDPAGASTTEWDPPRRFAVRQERGDWFNALEFTIEARGGGTTLMRYMHSGIFVDDWDSQYDGVAQHTDFYLHTLGEYLSHFQGRPVTYLGDVPMGIEAPPDTAGPDGFERLQRALGFGPAVNEGDEVRLTPVGLPPVIGVVNYRQPNFIGVRSSDALYCLFGRNAFGQPVALSIHSFADGVDAERAKRDWQRALAASLS
jgi:hypothetical protein